VERSRWTQTLIEKSLIFPLVISTRYSPVLLLSYTPVSLCDCSLQRHEWMLIGDFQENRPRVTSSGPARTFQPICVTSIGNHAFPFYDCRIDGRIPAFIPLHSLCRVLFLLSLGPNHDHLSCKVGILWNPLLSFLPFRLRRPQLREGSNGMPLLWIRASSGGLISPWDSTSMRRGNSQMTYGAFVIIQVLSTRCRC